MHDRLLTTVCPSLCSCSLASVLDDSLRANLETICLNASWHLRVTSASFALLNQTLFVQDIATNLCVNFKGEM